MIASVDAMPGVMISAGDNRRRRGPTADLQPRGADRHEHVRPGHPLTWPSRKSGSRPVPARSRPSSPSTDGATGTVIGFAALSAYKDRAAYSTTVEDSVYVDRNRGGGGVGTLLLTRLVEIGGRVGLPRRDGADRGQRRRHPARCTPSAGSSSSASSARSAASSTAGSTSRSCNACCSRCWGFWRRVQSPRPTGAGS